MVDTDVLKKMAESLAHALEHAKCPRLSAQLDEVSQREKQSRAKIAELEAGFARRGDKWVAETIRLEEAHAKIAELQQEIAELTKVRDEDKKALVVLNNKVETLTHENAALAQERDRLSRMMLGQGQDKNGNLQRAKEYVAKIRPLYGNGPSLIHAFDCLIAHLEGGDHR